MRIHTLAAVRRATMILFHNVHMDIAINACMSMRALAGARVRECVLVCICTAR